MIFRYSLSFCFSFLVLFVYPSQVSAIPSFLEGFTAKGYDSMPDPYSLHPQWWHYYDVEEPLLSQHISETLNHLQNFYTTLSPADQQAALPFINQFKTSLSALPEAKKEQKKKLAVPKNFHESYTLEQQLQLNQQWRKLQLDTEKDLSDLVELKDKIVKVHQNIDTLFADYLREGSKHTSARLLAGLEIMAQRAAVGLAEENRRLLMAEIESQQEMLGVLGKEVNIARERLNVAQYDENKLKHDIQTAQEAFERKHREISSAEAHAIGVRSQSPQERTNKQLLMQRAIYSYVEEASAWTRLAFRSLKYNLIMHANHLFTIENREVEEMLKEVKVHFKKVVLQTEEWKVQTQQEQDRIFHDQALISSSEGNAGSIHDARRLAVTQTLTLLQFLEEELAHVDWMIQQLEVSLRASDNFIVRGWSYFWDYMEEMGEKISQGLNSSLFKVFEIPITLITLFRVSLIIGLAYFFSYALRFAIQILGRYSQKEIYPNINRLMHYLVLLAAGILVLSSIGLDFNHVMILLGALVFGMGFGLQSVATNFICGLKILCEGKIKIGDYIELKSGRYGKVTEIHVQNTVIYTSDGIEIVVPNSELLSEPLVNWTMSNDHRRLHIPFSTAYDCDKELVRKVVSESAKHVSCTLKEGKRDPQVWLVKFGDCSLDFELVVWVNYKTPSFTESKEADYLWAIETALRENHIAMPTPEQIMYVRNQAADLGPAR